MKTLNLLRLASVCALFALGTATFTSCDPEDEKQIELPNKTEAIQKGYADDESTGGFTFVAKAAWTANVKEGLPTRANDVSWLRLKYEGSEKYSGEAGTFTLADEPILFCFPLLLYLHYQYNRRSSPDRTRSSLPSHRTAKPSRAKCLSIPARE